MSWQQLQEILEIVKQDYMDFATRPLESCPNDGWPLESGPNGELHCQFGGEVYDK